MKVSQIVVVILIAAAAVLGVSAMYCLLTMRLGLASYCVLGMGGVSAALLYAHATVHAREKEDAVVASVLRQMQHLAQRNK